MAISLFVSRLKCKILVLYSSTSSSCSVQYKFSSSSTSGMSGLALLTQRHSANARSNSAVCTKGALIR